MKTIKDLTKLALNRAVPANYTGTIEDVEGALREEIRKLVGNYKLFRRNRLDLYDLIQETIDAILPNKVAPVLGMFAEIQQYAQGDRPTFKVRLGRQRAKQFVTRVSPAGTYETFRLDQGSFDIPTDAYGGAAYVDFERYLDGLDTIVELYDIIIEGLTDKIYELVQNLLLASWDSTRPKANRVQANTFSVDKMLELTNVVSAYGAPVIFCAPQFAATMHNGMEYAAGSKSDIGINSLDLMERRTRGFIGVFHGVPVVVLPQSFTDETNTKFVINPRVAYVLPAGAEKIVKIAFEGDTIVHDWQNKGDRSFEIAVYKKMGAAIITPLHNWGIYENTSIVADGWDPLTTIA